MPVFKNGLSLFVRKLNQTLGLQRRWKSVAGYAKAWTDVESWFDSQQKQKTFLLPKTPRPDLDPPKLLFNKNRGLFTLL
jgi:hypothetical protein